MTVTLKDIERVIEEEVKAGGDVDSIAERIRTKVYDDYSLMTDGKLRIPSIYDIRSEVKRIIDGI